MTNEFVFALSYRYIRWTIRSQTAAPSEMKFPENLLSPNLNEVLLKAAKVVMHFTYPSYFTKNSKDCTPAFNDSWVKTRSVLNKNFKKYMEMFPKDSEFEYMFTYGKSGTCPSTQIKHSLLLAFMYYVVVGTRNLQY